MILLYQAVWPPLKPTPTTNNSTNTSINQSVSQIIYEWKQMRVILKSAKSQQLIPKSAGIQISETLYRISLMVHYHNAL